MSAPYYESDRVKLLLGDTLDVARTLPDGSADCIVTSPPYYGLRDYGTEGQHGAEETLPEYVDGLVTVLREYKRVLADDGTLWLNLGDSYARGFGGGTPGSKAATNRGSYEGRKLGKKAIKGSGKNLLMVPARVAIALQDDGWILRNDIVWHKGNAMPFSGRDRLANKYEHVFLFAKQDRYAFDLDPIREPLLRPEAADGSRTFGGSHKSKALQAGAAIGSGSRTVGSTYTSSNPLGKNPGDVWKINTRPFKGAHFATFPLGLPERCIKAGCKPGGTVLDPYSGSATTGLAALNLGRRYIGVDNKPEYHDLALSTRLANLTTGE